MQPLEWLEAGFRYTTISNRLYGPADLSGDGIVSGADLGALLTAWGTCAQ